MEIPPVFVDSPITIVPVAMASRFASVKFKDCPESSTPIVLPAVAVVSVTVDPVAVSVVGRVIAFASRITSLEEVFNVLLKTIPVPAFVRSTPCAEPFVPVVRTAPVNVVVPDPVVCVMLSASNARSAVTSAALTIETSNKSVVPPTIPSKSILPAPAVKLRF